MKNVIKAALAAVFFAGAYAGIKRAAEQDSEKDVYFEDDILTENINEAAEAMRADSEETIDIKIEE